MVNITIDKNNLSSYLKEYNIKEYNIKGYNIVIDSDILHTFSCDDTSEVEILILNIDEKNLGLLIHSFNNSNVSFRIEECSFKRIHIKDCVIKKIRLYNTEICGYENGQEIYDDNLFIGHLRGRIEIDNCQIHKRFIIRDNECIRGIGILKTIVTHSFSIIDSVVSKLQINTSEFNEINIRENCNIETINIFDSVLVSDLCIMETKLNSISIYKLISSKNENSKNNKIYINCDQNINTIDIRDSDIKQKLTIIFQTSEKVCIRGNSLTSCYILFSKISNCAIITNIFQNSFQLGKTNVLQEISNFQLDDNTFNGLFMINFIYFEKEFYIKNSKFNKYPSYIDSCEIQKECKTDFVGSVFTNLIFQNINFENVRMQSFDILNATFTSCEWIKKDSKYIVSDENNIHKHENLQLKKIYANLKTNYQNKNDYITSGKFYIAEQDVKREIARYGEHFILTAHKCISNYGESVSRSTFWLFFATIFFPFIYIFSGFKVGNEIIQHNLTLDIDNIYFTLVHLRDALFFSIKNLPPIPTNNKFFVSADESFRCTQIVELIQKMLNLIIFASFTEAFIRYLKK